MDTQNASFIKILKNQKLIRIIFIILNIIGFFADNDIEKNILNNNSNVNNNISSKKIYTTIIIISLIINIYYLYINNKQLEPQSNKEITKLRNISITLIIISSLIFLYIELSNYKEI